jgi:uncharacterized protein YyaL (SSP411 family)
VAVRSLAYNDLTARRGPHRQEVMVINRLAAEASPYLLQHADNPVDWFPWGDEAFEEARRRNVPIFLSVGYSSCHW